MDIQILLTITFLIGYAGIALESYVKLNKAAVALATGVLCWTVVVVFGHEPAEAFLELEHHLSQISSILFFLLGAMTIVELVDMHRGFDVVTRRIAHYDGSKLLWLIGLLTFFLSAVLDNLTTTIVLVSLLSKIIAEHRIRLLYVSLVVIAANAGGAWSPIGDVTTTMLWIKGQITTVPIMTNLFLPSLACLIVPVLILQYKLRSVPSVVNKNKSADDGSKGNVTMLILGVAALLFVPIFKSLTGLPPFVAILLGLSVIWMYSDHHKEKDEKKFRHTISDALQKIDVPTILFFLGILLAVSALEFGGLLKAASEVLAETFSDHRIIVVLIGLISAIVDNVPLVAAAQGLYSLDVYPADHDFWTLLAFCAGTGGSILIIGSAAGVAAMGKEKIDFMWYLKTISLVAMAGYFAGIAVYLIQHSLMS